MEEKIKITTWIEYSGCGDGCCSWSDAYAIIQYPGEDPCYTQHIGRYVCEDDLEEAALERFGVERDQVEFILT